jgi:hypothetical protein
MIWLRWAKPVAARLPRAVSAARESISIPVSFTSGKRRPASNQKRPEPTPGSTIRARFPRSSPFDHSLYNPRGCVRGSLALQTISALPCPLNLAEVSVEKASNRSVLVTFPVVTLQLKCELLPRTDPVQQCPYPQPRDPHYTRYVLFTKQQQLGAHFPLRLTPRAQARESFRKVVQS